MTITYIVIAVAVLNVADVLAFKRLMDETCGQKGVLHWRSSKVRRKANMPLVALWLWCRGVRCA